MSMDTDDGVRMSV